MNARTLTSAALIGLVLAAVLASCRVELDQFSNAQSVASRTVHAPSGHSWTILHWPGRLFTRDTLRVDIAGIAAPPPPDAEAFAAIPRPEWRGMVRDSLPICLSGHATFMLQSWGFPFRAMAGGFAEGPASPPNWYTTLTVFSSTHLVPTRPIWFGLLGNSLVYGTLVLPLLLLTHRGLRRFRRWRAARRQVCAECNYDLRATPAPAPCPECGTPRA